MVFLDLLVNVGCKRCLHTEDYEFDEAEEDAHRSLTARNVSAPSAAPKQYFFLGFKDRNLEDEYMEDLSRASKSRMLLGTFVSIFIFAVLFFRRGQWYYYTGKYEGSAGLQLFLPSCFAMAALLLGFAGVLCLYQLKRCKAKRNVFYIVGAAFMAYMGLMGYKFNYRIGAGFYDIDASDPSSWILRLIFYYAAPLVSIVFMGLPFLLTVEIVLVFTVVFLVVVPLANQSDSGVHYDAWSKFGDASISENYKDWDYADNLCTSLDSDGMCVFVNRTAAIQPLLVLCAVLVFSLFVSYFLGVTSRQMFMNKQIIEALRMQKERILVKQKEGQEYLIHSIFPPVIAKDLIKKHTNKESMLTFDRIQSTIASVESEGEGGSIGGVVARSHHRVTILFTDIVGFTSMSQSCKPHKVMHFLHDLFTAFDALIEMDPRVWKIETIGDAFMVASGLDMTTADDNGGCYFSSSLKASCQQSDTAYACAKAAVVFGMRALVEAQLLIMPNGEPCRIRAGVHTGSVCSGVVGTRMPRYTLFGDTVNTASRMESTSIPLRLQISEATHGMLRGDFEWEDRGLMEVKGKGKMRTYFLVVENEK